MKRSGDWNIVLRRKDANPKAVTPSFLRNASIWREIMDFKTSGSCARLAGALINNPVSTTRQPANLFNMTSLSQSFPSIGPVYVKIQEEDEWYCLT
jgi:hypothetical protein